MTKRNQHVVPLGNGWAVISEGSKRVAEITGTQRDAITVAREIAKNSRAELVIHGRDGRIRDKDSYRKYPNPPGDRRH